MAAGLDRFLTLERNGRLTFSGYGLNLLIAITCLGTLVYPFLDRAGILNANCLFKSITGLPCPTCGYSTAIGCLIGGDILHSFLHNPGWIFWVALQSLLLFIGIKSLLTGRQASIPGRLVIVLAALILLTWAAKFAIGREYY